MASLLDNGSVKGISIRSAWNSIEPTEGVFDWTYVDSILSQVAAAGKTASITIIPGVNTPQWVYSKGAVKFFFTDSNPFSPTFGATLFSPMPWDPVFLAAWNQFITAFAARYNAHPAISWIRITGPMNTLTGDWNLQSPNDWAKYAGTQNEFSDAKLVAAVNRVIDSFAASFTAKPLSVAIGRTKVTDSPPFLLAATAVANYGFTTYPKQFLIQSNGWDAQIPPLDVQDPAMQLYKRYAPYCGAQMVWSATNDPGCRVNGGISPCNAVTDLNGAVSLAKQYNVSFLEVYADDILNPDLQSILQGF